MSQSNGSSGHGSWGWMPGGELFPEEAEAPEASMRPIATPSPEPLSAPRGSAPPVQRRVVPLSDTHQLPVGSGSDPQSVPGGPTGALPLQVEQAPMRAYPPPRRPGPLAPRALGQAPQGAPAPVLDSFHRHLFGASTVMVGAGSLLGAHFGGLYGGIAGALFAGAGINALRAAHAGMQPDPAQKREATVSAVYATIGIGMGAYVWYKLDGKRSPGRARPNPRRKTTRRNEPRDCGFRPIGP